MDQTPTDELLDLIFLAIDHASKSVINTNGPLIPFAVIETASGERTLGRFTTGRNPNEARLHAREHVAQAADCRKYAIAADGAITENGQRIPVVMVEAGQRGKPNGFMFIQRFAPSGKYRFSKPLGNPGIIEFPPILGNSPTA